MLLKSILVIITLAYPFIVFFGLAHFDSIFVLVFIIGFLMIKGITEERGNTRKVIFMTVFSLLIVAYFCGNQQGLKLYPVLVNTIMFLFFTSSLYTKQSAIERLARIKEPDLPESGVQYTRKVTIAWSIFFALNGMAAMFTTFWTSSKVWLFYNGFLAYILIGLMVSIEWIIRYRVKHKS